MTTFVLVHGAYHGGWCWPRVAAPLRRAGHAVLTPTLTGLGDRAHLLSPEVGLHTMIEDVVGVFEAEELDGVVLVAHSFGALPVLGALARIARQVEHVVILDGIVVPPGEIGFAGLSDEVVRDRRAAARAHPSAVAIPPPPAEFFGVTEPVDHAWVTRRLRAHPLRSYTEPLPVQGPVDAGLPVTYLRCTSPVFPGLGGAEQVVRDQAWSHRTIPATHDAMITHPDLLVAELLRATRARRGG